MTYHIYSNSDNDNITGAANEGGELNNCQGLDLGKLGRRVGESQFGLFRAFVDPNLVSSLNMKMSGSRKNIKKKSIDSRLKETCGFCGNNKT